MQRENRRLFYYANGISVNDTEIDEKNDDLEQTADSPNSEEDVDEDTTENN